MKWLASDSHGSSRSAFLVPLRSCRPHLGRNAQVLGVTLLTQDRRILDAALVQAFA